MYRKKVLDRAEKLKEGMEEYISVDIEKFLKEFYILCYNQYVKYEKDIQPINYDELNSKDILEKILDVKEKLSKIPIKDVNIISNRNHFYQVYHIFDVEPKRWGLYGDEIIWSYIRFYFWLFDISLDLMLVDVIIKNVWEILEVYFKYADFYCSKDVIRVYWEKNLDAMIKFRYDLWTNEMERLCFNEE